MNPSFTIGMAFISTIIFLKLLEPAAKKFGLIDIPGGRKAHLSATPDHGGVAIFLGLTISVIFSASLLQLYWPFLLLAFFVLAVGVADDIFDISAKLRLVLHGFIVITLVSLTDIRIESLGNLFGFGNIELGLLSYPFTVFCFLAGINAVNMIDGIDGLAGGLVLIPLALLGVFLLGTNAELTQFAAITCFSIAAFLISNYRSPWRKRARVFLGDSGSTLIGFLLVWFLVKATQVENGALPPITALWLLAIPLIDSGCVIAMRKKEGKSIMAPARDHVHHRLLDAGLSVMKTTLLLHVISISLCVIAITCIYTNVNEWLLFALIIGLFVANLYAGTHFLSLLSNSPIIRSPLLRKQPAELVAIQDAFQEEISNSAMRNGKKAA